MEAKQYFCKILLQTKGNRLRKEGGENKIKKVLNKKEIE